MSLHLTVFGIVWRDISNRLTQSASAISSEQFPDLSSRAIAQAAEFARLPLPDSGHDLNCRRVSANSILKDWQAEIQRSGSAVTEDNPQ